VQPAETVDGLLKVPENVQHVGWWDGSAQAGEPFGATVTVVIEPSALTVLVVVEMVWST